MVRRVRALAPHEDLLFFADQAHVPYGERGIDDLADLLQRNVASLASAGVDAIVMGCNTTCAVAAERGWPEVPVPIFDLIAAAADTVAASGARRIGVLATTATARSGAYGTAIRARRGDADVQEVAAPALVPLVESGTLDGPLARAAVAAALAEFAGPLDALVLACTHYPLLDAQFAAVLGPGVRRIDPAAAQAERVAAYLATRPGSAGSGATRYLTNGALEPFAAAVAAIAGPLGPRDTVALAAEAPAEAPSPLR